jgi:hypothetical protein
VLPAASSMAFSFGETMSLWFLAPDLSTGLPDAASRCAFPSPERASRDCADPGRLLPKRRRALSQRAQGFMEGGRAGRDSRKIVPAKLR